jgi:menaquinone-dependent protoporphyrinogen IX oxidase
MKIYIICNSKTGFTRRYADWIAGETGGIVVPYKELGKTAIEAEDTVIFGSRLHAGRVEHLGKIKARFGNHRLVVFAVGGAPNDAAEATDKIWSMNFTEEERTLIPHFYMQGGLNYEKMGFLDRTMMKTAAKMMSKQKSLGPEDAGFAEAIQNSYDISSREYIEPLLACVKNLA